MDVRRGRPRAAPHPLAGRIAPGRSISTPVTSPDLYPTLLAAAGLTPDPGQQIDGENFLPALRGESYARSRPLFWHYPHYSNQGGTPTAAVREGNWKLVRFFEDSRCELYDLVADLEEKHDRSAAEPQLVERLNAALSDWLADVQALIPGSNPMVTFDDLPG